MSNNALLGLAKVYLSYRLGQKEAEEEKQRKLLEMTGVDLDKKTKEAQLQNIQDKQKYAPFDQAMQNRDWDALQGMTPEQRRQGYQTTDFAAYKTKDQAPQKIQTLKTWIFNPQYRRLISDDQAQQYLNDYNKLAQYTGDPTLQALPDVLTPAIVDDLYKKGDYVKAHPELSEADLANLEQEFLSSWNGHAEPIVSRITGREITSPSVLASSSPSVSGPNGQQPAVSGQGITESPRVSGSNIDALLQLGQGPIDPDQVNNQQSAVGSQGIPDNPQTSSLLALSGDVPGGGVYTASTSKQTTNPRGMIQQGNIDISKRPIVHNADGSISTVRSITVGIDDGRTVVLPTVSDDGHILTNDQAIQQFRKTGRHLGIFSNLSDAEAYSQALHEDQAQRYSDQSQSRPLFSSPGMSKADKAQLVRDRQAVMDGRMSKEEWNILHPDIEAPKLSPKAEKYLNGKGKGDEYLHDDYILANRGVLSETTWKALHPGIPYPGRGPLAEASIAATGRSNRGGGSGRGRSGKAEKPADQPKLGKRAILFALKDKQKAKAGLWGFSNDAVLTEPILVRELLERRDLQDGEGNINDKGIELVKNVNAEASGAPSSQPAPARREGGNASSPRQGKGNQAVKTRSGKNWGLTNDQLTAIRNNLADDRKHGKRGGETANALREYLVDIGLGWSDDSVRDLMNSFFWPVRVRAK